MKEYKWSVGLRHKATKAKLNISVWAPTCDDATHKLTGVLIGPECEYEWTKNGVDGEVGQDRFSARLKAPVAHAGDAVILLQRLRDAAFHLAHGVVLGLANKVRKFGAVTPRVDGPGIALHVQNEIDGLVQRLPLVRHAAHPLPVNIQLVGISGLFTHSKIDEVQVIPRGR